MQDSTVGIYEAKTHLSQLVDEVAAGKTFTITRHGVPVAVLCPPDRVRLSTTDLADEFRALRAKYRLEGITVQQLIDETRAAR